MLRSLLLLALAVVVAATMFAIFGCGRKHSRPEASSDTASIRPFLPGGAKDRFVHAVCYGPHRDGQFPGGPAPSAAEIREDLDLMLPHWNLLRTYGSSGFAETMLELIRENGLDMKVMLGAWIGAEEPLDPASPAAADSAAAAAAANRRELDAAIRLANAYPEIVVAVCVGNETQVYWSGHRSPAEVLIRHLRRVRAEVSVPVSTADDIDFWLLPESRAVAGEVDFITFHAHPMWKGILLDGAMPWLRDRLAAMGELHPDRHLVIGETGWATSVHDQGEQAELIRGEPGEAQQKIFHDAMRARAETENLTVFVFEAFDENWKGGPHPAEVEKHWGLFNADRSPKRALAPAAP